MDCVYICTCAGNDNFVWLAALGIYQSITASLAGTRRQLLDWILSVMRLMPKMFMGRAGPGQANACEILVCLIIRPNINSDPAHGPENRPTAVQLKISTCVFGRWLHQVRPGLDACISSGFSMFNYQPRKVGLWPGHGTKSTGQV